MDITEQVTIKDTFGRLPDDVLKYMLLLNTVPKITFKNDAIHIELPLLGIHCNFIFHHIYSKELVRTRIYYIDKFNNDKITTLHCGNEIDIKDKFIYFVDGYISIKIDIQYLQLVKNALEEYKSYLQNQLKNDKNDT
jgi:hypothetical protein